MGARFRELRLRLRPDLAKHQAFGDTLQPPVTLQTVRNWEHGRHIPDKAKRAIGALTGCDPEDFFADVGAPLKRETHVLALA
jgi:DNA-binding transcriptional regulator YiaG